MGCVGYGDGDCPKCRQVTDAPVAVDANLRSEFHRGWQAGVLYAEASWNRSKAARPCLNCGALLSTCYDGRIGSCCELCDHGELLDATKDKS